jgi:membrane protein
MSSGPEVSSHLKATGQRLRGMALVLREHDPSEIASPVVRGTVSLLRFFYILFKEARNDHIWQRSSTLTYTSILALFPLLILLTSMGSLFYTADQETQLIEFIERRLLPPPDAGLLSPGQMQELDERLVEIASLTSRIREMSANFRETAPRVGFAGFLALLIAAYILYQSIESSFEAAWGESRHRTSLRRSITGFAFLLVFAPVLIGGSITASSFLVSILGHDEVTLQTREEGPATDEVPPSRGWEQSPAPRSAGAGASARPIPPAPPRSGRPVGVVLSLLPFLLNSLMLALAYILIPRAKVKWQYALLGGLAAGLLWELAKVGFFYYVYLSASRRQMLRALGAVPIFLVWLYFTWTVFLLGNYLVYVSQNLVKLQRHYFGKRSATLLDGHIFAAIALIVCDAFTRDERGVRQDDLALRMRVRFDQLDDILYLMRRHGFLSLTAEGRIVPARPPEHIPMRDLLDLGCDPRYLCLQEEWQARPRVDKALQEMVEQRRDLLKGKTVADLLGPGPSRLAPDSSRVDLRLLSDAELDALEERDEVEVEQR